MGLLKLNQFLVRVNFFDCFNRMFSRTELAPRANEESDATTQIPATFVRPNFGFVITRAL